MFCVPNANIQTNRQTYEHEIYCVNVEMYVPGIHLTWRNQSNRKYNGYWGIYYKNINLNSRL